MDKPKQDLSQWKNNMLVFKGHEHPVSKVIAVAHGSPLIDVKLSDVIAEAPEQLTITIKPSCSAVSDLDLTVIKVDNKFLVLLGASHVEAAYANKQAVVKARLVSTVALKGARKPPVVAVSNNEPIRRSEPARTPYSDRRYNNDRY